MNLLAHAFVTAKAFDDKHAMPLALGATLPDLCGIAKVPLTTESLAPLHRLGVETHYAADKAFHSHPHFTAACLRLRRAMETKGLERAPARACAHVGYELLLDGTLQSSWLKALPLAQLFDSLSEPCWPTTEDHANRFATATAGVRRRVEQAVYQSPDGVAQRLHELLAERSRLAFQQRHIALIASCLTAELPVLLDNRDVLLKDVTAFVRSECRD